MTDGTRPFPHPDKRESQPGEGVLVAWFDIFFKIREVHVTVLFEKFLGRVNYSTRLSVNHKRMVRSLLGNIRHTPLQLTVKDAQHITIELDEMLRQSARDAGIPLPLGFPFADNVEINSEY